MKNKKIMLISLILIVLIILTGCESWKRTKKDWNSNMSGLDRVLKVYSYDGELIAAYEGKFDISENSNGTKVKFDIDGKRIIIYNAIVIVEEK